VPSEYRGVIVTTVQPGTPAAERLFPNDVIAEVLYPQPKATVRSAEDLQRALERVNAGEIISLLVYRGVAGQGGGTVVINLRAN
jgi:S1-C subfamily serine protease